MLDICNQDYDSGCLRGSAPPWHAPRHHPAFTQLRCCARHWLARSGLAANDQHWQRVHGEHESLDENWRLARLRAPLINDRLLVSDMLAARLAHAVLHWDLHLRTSPGWLQLRSAGNGTLIVAVYQYAAPHSASWLPLAPVPREDICSDAGSGCWRTCCASSPHSSQ